MNYLDRGFYDINEIAVKYGYSFDEMSFDDVRQLIAWFYGTGHDAEELELIKKELLDQEYVYSFITEYLRDYYCPLIKDMAKRGDYYTAKCYLERLFKIYGLSDYYYPFVKDMNEMYLIYLILQNCWDTTINRSFTDAYIDRVLNLKQSSDFFYEEVSVPPCLSYVDSYFDGIYYIGDDDYVDARIKFQEVFDSSDYQYVKELASMMIVRCDTWIYEFTQDYDDLQIAKKDILKATQLIHQPFFDVELIGYWDRIKEINNSIYRY